MGRLSVIELLPETWLVLDSDLPGVVHKAGGNKHRYGIGIVKRVNGVYQAGSMAPRLATGKTYIGDFPSLRDACRAIEVAFFGLPTVR